VPLTAARAVFGLIFGVILGLLASAFGVFVARHM
jgi:hypothetical protein